MKTYRLTNWLQPQLVLIFYTQPNTSQINIYVECKLEQNETVSNFVNCELWVTF